MVSNNNANVKSLKVASRKYPRVWVSESNIKILDGSAGMCMFSYGVAPKVMYRIVHVHVNRVFLKYVYVRGRYITAWILNGPRTLLHQLVGYQIQKGIRFETWFVRRTHFTRVDIGSPIGPGLPGNRKKGASGVYLCGVLMWGVITG